MNKMLQAILFVLFITSFAARKNCNALHSNFFSDNYGKTNTQFFVRETFTFIDPCETITNSKFRAKYPQYLSDNQVEHIIDKENSEQDLETCDKNIIGNLVLANGAWNMGAGQLCWDNAKIEKSLVYGDIFPQAMDNVHKCCHTNPNYPEFRIMAYIICGLSVALLFTYIGMHIYVNYINPELDDDDL